MHPSLVAGGIKIALLTTVFGLSVAIILQIFYNYILSQIDSIVNDLKNASISLLDLLVNNKINFGKQVTDSIANSVENKLEFLSERFDDEFIEVYLDAESVKKSKTNKYWFNNLFLNITHEIDQVIQEKSKAQPDLAGMGTTLTALSIFDKNIELLHIGDSRCYRYRDNKLEQLSYDHTVMQELLDQGRLTPQEVFDHPQRSLLTQALMGDSGLDPILISFEIKKGDRYLLCSDGLTNVLSDYEISKIIEANEDKAIPQSLITEVRSKGAPDNITIIWSLVSAEKQSDQVEKLGAANE